MAERIAVVDIGTNTLLLLVVQRDGDGLTRIHDACKFGRLGKGLDTSGNLADESIERSLAITREYRAEMDRLGVTRVAAVGTQALREAGNAALFREPAEAVLGAPIQIIAGEREAELVALSVARSLPELAEGTFAIADVGGGSTEIIVSRDGAVDWYTSLAIGSVRFAERHLVSDPPTADQSRAMIADIDRALAGLDLPDGAPLVATAGTATTIATVERRMRVFDADAINGLRLPPAAVERQLARHLELSVSERRSMPGLEPERADVIPAGVAIYARLMRAMNAPELIVSDRGVRWGLAHALAEGAG